MSDTLFSATNFLDRAIEYVSPSLAARRYAARAQIGMARDASHRGAIASRSATPWSMSQSYRGGKVSDRRDQFEMCHRSRRSYAENVIARSLLNTETDNVVGDSLSLQMLSGSPEFNAEAEGKFYKWLDKADIQGLATGADIFRSSWREPRKDGDGGLLLIKRGGYPYLQYIPGDLIRNPLDGFDMNVWFDGVQCNQSGRPIAFNLLDYAPDGTMTDTIVAARDFVYLAPSREPLSVRGTTVYATIFGYLDQLDTYVDAVTKAAIMGAIFGLIEKRKNPAAAMSGLGTMPNSQGDNQKVVTYENGMVKIIGSEDSVLQVQAQQPMQQTPDFIRALMRLVCLAFDMPLEIGQKDLSQVNFSGGRIGLIGYYRSCRTKQDWLKSSCWNRIVYWWLSVEQQRQVLGFPDAFTTPFPADYGTFELHGREWEYNDPTTEATADLIEVSIGTNDIESICEKRGRDYKKIRAKRKAQLDADRADGLPVVLSTTTRDERQSVTAVDTNGNPISGSAQPLNGAQITAAIDVLAKVREGALSDAAAAELLVQIGIAADKARAIVTSLASLTSGSGDVAFKREVLKQLLAVPAAREAVYNAMDIEDLVSATGLPPENGYEVPWIPVVAPTGPLVSGDIVYDPQGDIVGGDVENSNPPADVPPADAVPAPADPPSPEDQPPQQEDKNVTD